MELKLSDVSDLATLAALVAATVSTVGLVYTFRKDWKQKRVQATMSMHNKWTCKEYASSRSISFEKFLEILAGELEGKPSSIAQRKKPKISISKLYQVTGKENLGLIEHFFDDLGRLAKADQIDKKLSCVLFKDVADYWKSIFDIVSWEEDAEKLGWYNTQLSENLNYLYSFWGVVFDDRKQDMIVQSLKKR